MVCLAVFLGSRLRSRCRISPGGSPYCPASARRVDLPARLLAFAVQRAFPSARGLSASPSPHRPAAGLQNLYCMSIGSASRLPLRSRLTLIRLALIRNPWSYGGEVSRLPYRYLFLHLLFRCLQKGSRPAFSGLRNAPLPSPSLRRESTASASGLCPRIIHAGPLD